MYAGRGAEQWIAIDRNEVGIAGDENVMKMGVGGRENRVGRVTGVVWKGEVKENWR